MCSAVEIDEVILSTLPPGVSRWLKRDLPRRIRVEFGLPVIHVSGPPAPETLRLHLIGPSRVAETADTA